MIVKSGSKYTVKSEGGRRRLGGPYKTKSEAVRRLKQVEWFKAHKPAKG